MKKVTKGDLDQFTDDRFNSTYRDLIDIGNIDPDEEHRIMGALGFTKDLQELVENIKEDYAAEPDDTQSQTNKEHELRAEIQQLRQWVKELLPEDLKNKSEPQIFKVCK